MNPRRAPEGTPPILKVADQATTRTAKAEQHAKLQEKLKSDEMRQWIRSRVLAEGVVNLAVRLNLLFACQAPDLCRTSTKTRGSKSRASYLPVTPTLPTLQVPCSGDSSTFTSKWYVPRQTLTHRLQPTGVPIHTLSLANNDFHHLRQLNRLPRALPYLRALDLSNNPIRTVGELDVLLAQGEKKGKATAGVGSLKSLVELKLTGCTFREKTVAQPNGDETYQQ
jgi:nuclear RNA export factor